MSDDITSARLHDIARRYALTDSSLRQMELVLGCLSTRPDAPTTVTDPARAVDVHIADSLAIFDLALPGDIARVVDLGSGAGFPGIPVAIARPEWTVHLVESQSRKCAFAQHVIDTAGIGNCAAVCTRAEEYLAQGHQPADLLLARALAPQSVVLEYAAPLLRVGGVLVDWRGQRSSDEEMQAEAAAEILGLERLFVDRTVPFAGAVHHHLHVFMKRYTTPSSFPRRSGIARKRPLGVAAVTEQPESSVAAHGTTAP